MKQPNIMLKVGEVKTRSWLSRLVPVSPMQGYTCILCSMLLKYNQFPMFPCACFFVFTRGQHVGL